MTRQELDALRAKAEPTREDVDALIAEIDRQRAMVQRNIEAYWEAGAKLSRSNRDLAAAAARADAAGAGAQVGDDGTTPAAAAGRDETGQ